MKLSRTKLRKIILSEMKRLTLPAQAQYYSDAVESIPQGPQKDFLDQNFNHCKKAIDLHVYYQHEMLGHSPTSHEVEEEVLRRFPVGPYQTERDQEIILRCYHILKQQRSFLPPSPGHRDDYFQKQHIGAPFKDKYLK